MRLWIITERKETAVARTPIHAGEILADELEETGLSAKKLADMIEVPPNRLYQLIAGKRTSALHCGHACARVAMVTPPADSVSALAEPNAKSQAADERTSSAA